jgi:hypothetical protein
MLSKNSETIADLQKTTQELQSRMQLKSSEKNLLKQLKTTRKEKKQSDKIS